MACCPCSTRLVPQQHACIRESEAITSPPVELGDSADSYSFRLINEYPTDSDRDVYDTLAIR